MLTETSETGYRGSAINNDKRDNARRKCHSDNIHGKERDYHFKGYTLRSADSSEPGYELKTNLSGYATNPTRQASEPVVKIASIRILKDSDTGAIWSAM